MQSNQRDAAFELAQMTGLSFERTYQHTARTRCTPPSKLTCFPIGKNIQSHASHRDRLGRVATLLSVEHIPFVMYNDSSDSISLRTETPLRPWYKEPKNVFIMLLLGALAVICLLNYLPKAAPTPAPGPSMRAIVVLGGSAGVSGQLVLKQPSGQNVQVRTLSASDV